MTTLRTAAQQALKALEADCGGRCNAEYNPCWQREAAETLRAALAEDAMQKFTDVNQELEAALAEPVQEPYCYIYEYDGAFGLHREFYPGTYNGKKPSRTVPLYTAPPQRKPLTDEEIDSIWDSEKAFADIYAIVRAVERAHGIV